MSAERRRQVILVALLVVLAVAVWVRLGPGSGRPGATRSGGVGEAATWADPEAAPQVAELRLELLDRPSATYTPGRNPFAFGQVQRVAPPPPPPPPPPRQRQAQTRRADPPRPQPPPVQFKYLGSFGPEDRRIAVFLDGEDIINAMVGDVLKKHFIVGDIGFESAEIRFVDFPNAPGQRLAAGG